MKKIRLNGVVTPYTGNGRKLGFPTANIPIDSDAEEGLFVGTVLLQGKQLPALIFIGAPITLNDQQKRAEAYILDFKDRDLYGEQVVFELLEKLRKNIKFSSTQKLIAQMEKDEADAKEYFKRREE